MLIQFVILSFGFVFTHRMIEFQIARKPLPEAISNRIMKTQILFFWFLTILSPWIPVPLLIFFLFVPNLAAGRLDWILNFILRHQFQQNLVNFIDEVILLMMTGKSFRDSFLHLTTNSQHFFHVKLRELFAVGNFQTQFANSKHKELIQIAELVQSIEKNPHKSIDKLRAFRRQLHWAISFKRKSKLATTQIRAQAMILSFLYLALFVFVAHSQGSQMNSVFLPSLILFLLGLISLFLLGRRQKWKT